MKRYWLMKLVDYDKESKVETWKCLNLGTKKPHELNNFLFNGYRIYDIQENKVVKTNLDLHKWLNDKSL